MMSLAYSQSPAGPRSDGIVSKPPEGGAEHRLTVYLRIEPTGESRGHGNPASYLPASCFSAMTLAGLPSHSAKRIFGNYKNPALSGSIVDKSPMHSSRPDRYRQVGLSEESASSDSLMKINLFSETRQSACKDTPGICSPPSDNTNKNLPGRTCSTRDYPNGNCVRTVFRRS